MKRIFDITLSLFLIIILSPIMIVVALIIYFKIGKPIIFKQTRAGLNGKLFTIYKFRTMSNRKDKNGELLPDEQRLKGVGLAIRRTSLDELPQLFNVLKGDMSFVGPRPLLAEYLHLYNSEQKRRHSVLPGITGWAQVNGRNAISWEEKFKLDVWYVDNNSFWLDIKILWLTFLKVLERSDISSASHITVEKFKGNSIYIYGASGHGLVVADIAKICGYSDIILIDDGDNEYLSFDDIKKKTQIPIAFGIGNNMIRKELFKKVKKHGFKVATLIHKDTTISDSVTIGEGTVIMAGVIINPYSNIGKGVILNSSSTIEHESLIEDFVHISPNVALAGAVKIKESTHIGIGSSIIQGITIGERCIVGAGSVVVKDIKDRSIAYGNPCQVIREIDD